MNKLVELLFEYARIDNQQYELHCERLDLSELLRKLVASMYSDFESRSIFVDIDLPEKPVYFNGDHLELSRAVGNFLNNAIFHIGAGNHVGVSLRINCPEDGTVEYQILVSDDGDAIPEELASKLFTPFVVGDESRSSRGGSGLGLAITRKIIERHGGRTMLLPGPEGFTKSFAIVLPGEFSRPATGPQSNESSPEGKRIAE